MEEKKPVVEFTGDQLSEIVGKTLGEKLTPIVESVQEMNKRVEDLEATKPKIVEAPETTEDPVDIEERKKNFKPRVPRDERELPPDDEFSFVRFINAQRNNSWKGAEYEEYAVMETRKKAISWASGSSGGYWVDSQFLPEEFIANLTAKIVCRTAGCRVLKCTGSPVNIPTKTAGATAYWVAQNAALTASDQTPGQVQLTPHWCTGRTQISEFLAETSAGAAEQIVREDLAEVIGIAVDTQMLIGAGTSNKPLGLNDVATRTSRNGVVIGTNGGALTLTHLHSMLYELEVDNVQEDGLVWIMHPRTWNGIRQFLINSEPNRYIINPTPTAQEPRSILGIPVYRTTSLRINLTKNSGSALAEVFLVNIKDVILAEWGTLQLKATDVGGNAWAQNAIEVKATYTMDVAPRHEQSVCYLNDTTT